MKAVVLAAGVGDRLRPFTYSIAKPMMPIANRPVMEHIIVSLRKHGFREIFCNLYYRPADMTDYFRDGSPWGVSIVWRVEGQLTGPAGAIMTFADVLKDERDFVVISGDALHDIDLRALVDFHKEHKALLSVVMKRVKNLGRYGVGLIDKDSRIVHFQEKPVLDASTEGLVSCGIYCVSHHLLERIPGGVIYDFGADLIPLLAAQEEAVFCFETSSYWRDIGNTAEFKLANLDVISRRVNLSIPGELLREGVYIEPDVVLAPDIDIIPPVLIGRGTCIERGVKITGPSILGASCIVGKGAHISHSVLLQRVQVLSDTAIVDALLGNLTPIEH